MNILEALKTGRRFRRVGYAFWQDNSLITGLPFRGSTVDIQSGDWEIEPEKKKRVKLFAYLTSCGNMENRFEVFYTKDLLEDPLESRVPEFDKEIEIEV